MPVSLRAFTDAAAEAVAAEIATFRKEIAREREVQQAQFAARLAEMEARSTVLGALERQISDRLSLVKNGEPGRDGTDVDMAAVAASVGAEVERILASWERPKDGTSVTIADVEPLLAGMVDRAVAALPAPANGKDADPSVINAMVAEAISSLPPAQAGKDADPEQVAALVKSEAERILGTWERPQDGKSVTLDDVAPLIQKGVQEAVASIPAPKDGKDGDPGPEGPAGKLGVAKAWSDRVHYEGEVVTLAGSTYQATRDTGRAPPSDDWIVIAAAGSNGADGRSFKVRGTWAEDADYDAFDVVMLNGASFVAKRDAPGVCPGDGWQLLAMQGKRGNQGDRGAAGPKGDRGEPGSALIALDVDANGLLSAVNGDGSIVTCDLYPLLSRIGG